MKKEEDKIYKKIGTENSFQVPDGYFENLTSEIMNKLPEKKDLSIYAEVTLWQKVKPWAYMAAMFIGAALIIRVGTMNRKDNLESASVDEFSEEYINASIDHSLLDDYTYYLLLSDSENNNLEEQ